MTSRPMFITPSGGPGEFARFLIQCPSLDNQDWWSLMIGALLLLTEAENWEQSIGGLTPEETAETWQECLSDWLNQDVE